MIKISTMDDTEFRKDLPVFPCALCGKGFGLCG